MALINSQVGRWIEAKSYRRTWPTDEDRIDPD